MDIAKLGSDNSLTTALNITKYRNGDIVLKIIGDDEFRIKASGGNLTGIRLRKIKSLFSEIISELNKGVLNFNKEQLANMLNGRVRGHELTPEEQEVAKENDLVVVFGYSDDSMIFNGAIHGQADCWQGGVAYLDEKGLKKTSTENTTSKSIRAVYAESSERLFHGKSYWSFETDIPHAKFLIYEDEIGYNEAQDIDDEVWCEGIVFDVAALST